MRKARVNGKLVAADPEAPQKAVCPDCGGEVHKRSRKKMRGGVTYFYRHKRGVGKECPKRYRPT
jgi:uncharacterized protein with PIN domain